MLIYTQQLSMNSLKYIRVSSLKAKGYKVGLHCSIMAWIPMVQMYSKELKLLH